MTLASLVDTVRARHGGESCVLALAEGGLEQAVERGLGCDEPRLVGSVTKLFTAEAALRLARAGVLDLDASLARALPVPGPAEHATATHLLTHSAGWQGEHGLDTGEGSDALLRYVASLAALPQLAPPGWCFSYSNSGFTTLGCLLEHCAEQPYEELVRAEVLEPLGLRASGFPAASERPPELPRSALPSGGLRSTASELLRFAREQLGSARADEQQPRLSAGSLAEGVGLGWMVDDFDGTRVLKHGGHVAGQSALVAAVPERGVAFAALCDSSELLGDLFGTVFRERLGLIQCWPEGGSRPAEELEPYEGSWTGSLVSATSRAAAGGLELVVRDRVGALLLEEHMLFTGPQRLAGPTRRADFVLASSGEPRWLRWDGRLALRGRLD